MMPTLIISLDSVSIVSADPNKSPVKGAAPHLSGSWYAKQLRQRWGVGRPCLSGSSSCLGRRRENQPGSVTETNCRWAELVLSTVLNLGRWRTGCSSISRQRPLAPSVPRGTASPAGLYQLDKGVRYRTWERVLCLPPGRPFRRDFGDFYSCKPNYLHLFSAKKIFLVCILYIFKNWLI